MKNYSLKYLIEGLIGYKAKIKSEPRAEIWASDLGKMYADTYLSMKGALPTNPADSRGLRTFFIGNQIEKGMIDLLDMCGFMKSDENQTKITIQRDGCLPVVGRPDLILEVKDWQEVEDKIRNDIADKKKNLKKGEENFLNRLQEQLDAYLTALEAFKQMYPDGLDKSVFELKSVNSMALKYAKQAGVAVKYPHYVLQLYTYMLGLGLSEGHLVLVGKDYAEMEELIITRTPELDAKWLAEVQKISDNYMSGVEPSVAEYFDKKGKPSWQIEYSKFRDYYLAKPIK